MRVYSLYKILKEKNYTTLAGSIAFFFIINGGALIFLISLIFNLFNLRFTAYFPSTNPFVNELLLYVDNNSLSYFKTYSFILIVTSIWSSSTLFYHLLKSGELIYEKKRKKYPFFIRILSVLFVAIFLVIILSSIIILILGNLILAHLNNNLLSILIKIFMLLIVPSIAIFFFLIFVPPVKLKFKNVYKGALFTLSFWIVSTLLFQIYLNIFNNFKAIYGALTFVIIGMIYIYLLAIGLVIGLVINLLTIVKVERQENGENKVEVKI